MNSPTAIALTGFIAWTLALLLLMEVMRSKLVLTQEIATNGFVADNANLSPFMRRLARAHANCLEGLPLLGGLMLVALATNRAAVTDPPAYVLLGARIARSSIHLASLSRTAVTARFTALPVPMALALWCCWRLLAG